MLKIGIFGGTFNPIHNGHLYLSESIGKMLNLDKVIVLPANVPPHKEWLNVTDSYHRYVMCCLACEGKSFFEVNDYEISENGMSYTINTLRYLSQKYLDCKLYLIMGADSFASVMKWYKFEEIIKVATLCTAPRDCYDAEKLYDINKILISKGADTIIFNLQEIPISSTLVRKNINEGKKIDDIVPIKVADYIIRNNLFKRME